MKRGPASGGAECNNTNGWDRVFTSLLSKSATLLFFLLLSSLFVKHLAIFGPQEMWGFVQGQSFFGKKLGSKILCKSADLRLGYGSVS